MIQNTFLRYGKAFHYVRQIIKHFLSWIYPIFRIFYKMPKVESVFETLEKLTKNSELSLVRFGDGEIVYINDKLNLPFQQYDEKLATCYKDIFKNNNPNLLVGLPIGYQDLNQLSKEGKLFWRSQIVWNYPRFKKYLNLDAVYANASVTRLTYGFEKEYTIKAFNYWKKILKGNKVLLIEGEKSRFGVGNDILSNIDTIHRILAPKHNAFSKCDEIIKYIENHTQKYEMILVALGPAAKYLVFELYKKGYKVIDVGNLDIEYEWYIRGASEERIVVPGKYTSEVKGGREVDEIPDSSSKLKYESEIIAKFL